MKTIDEGKKEIGAGVRVPGPALFLRDLTLYMIQLIALREAEARERTFIAPYKQALPETHFLQVSENSLLILRRPRLLAEFRCILVHKMVLPEP